MRPTLAVLINKLITFLLVVIAFGLPMLFIPAFTEYFEMPKVIVLVALSVVLLTLWVFTWVLEGKVLITRTPLDLPLLLFLAVVVLSVFSSNLPVVSVFGNLPKLHGSGASWFAYIIIYFVTASHLKNLKQVKGVLYAMLTGAGATSLLSILAYFGINAIPTHLTRVAIFSLTGSIFSAAALPVLLLPLPLLSLTNSSTNGGTFGKILPKPVALVLATLFALTIVLAGNINAFAGALLAFALVLYINKKGGLIQTIRRLAIPLAVTIVVFSLSLIPSKGKFQNPLYEKRQSFAPNAEIQLPLPISWKIAVSAFRDAPFLGTGPSTFLYDFSFYKPAEYNNTKLWNSRFDSARNEFLQILATMGGAGLLSLVFIAGVVLVFAWTALFKKNKEGDQADSLSSALSVSAILVVVLLGLHVSTPVVLVTSLLLLALLMATHRNVSDKVEEITLGIKVSKFADSNFIVGDILPLIVFVPTVVLLGVVFWNLIPFIRADYYHWKGINALTSKGIDAYNELIKAAKTNLNVDLYRLDLAQTNFLLANQIAQTKGPTEGSPSGSLTDQDKQNIQKLLSQAITEGRAAVALNQLNSQNWELLGSIYRQISGVAQNAMQFALDSYGRAIIRDPLNPMLRLSVGGIYYSIKDYNSAIRFFGDAVTLKPDFANGYYNLSVALRDKGDLQPAVTAAEKVVSLLDTKSPDYKAASDYLKDLKDRIATGSVNQAKTEAPAAQETAPLQKKNLPKVLDLPKPDSVATPPAVKKP